MFVTTVDKLRKTEPNAYADLIFLQRHSEHKKLRTMQKEELKRQKPAFEQLVSRLQDYIDDKVRKGSKRGNSLTHFFKPPHELLQKRSEQVEAAQILQNFVNNILLADKDIKFDELKTIFECKATCKESRNLQPLYRRICNMIRKQVVVDAANFLPVGQGLTSIAVCKEVLSDFQHKKDIALVNATTDKIRIKKHGLSVSTIVEKNESENQDPIQGMSCSTHL